MNKNNAHFVKESVGQNFDDLPDPVPVDTSEEAEDRGDDVQEQVDELTAAFPDEVLEPLNGGSKTQKSTRSCIFVKKLSWKSHEMSHGL
jgi:hypothetical protein